MQLISLMNMLRNTLLSMLKMPTRSAHKSPMQDQFLLAIIHRNRLETMQPVPIIRYQQMDMQRHLPVSRLKAL